MVGHRKSYYYGGYSGLMVVFILSFLIVYTGCGKKEEKGVQERTFNVRAVTVEKRALRPFVELSLIHISEPTRPY